MDVAKRVKQIHTQKALEECLACKKWTYMGTVMIMVVHLFLPQSGQHFAMVIADSSTPFLLALVEN